METITATKIGLGTGEGAKYVGQYYVIHNKAHVTLGEKCTLTEEADRWPVSKVADGHYAHTREEAIVVTLCSVCGDTTFDTSWMDMAACRDTMDDRFFDSRRYPRAVAKYCAKCPVALECLEAGAARDRDNIGSTWGGLYFTRVNEVRREGIKEQKAALLRGEMPEGAASPDSKAKGPCTEDGCEKPVLARELCSSHYNKLWKAGVFK